MLHPVREAEGFRHVRIISFMPWMAAGAFYRKIIAGKTNIHILSNGNRGGYSG